MNKNIKKRWLSALRSGKYRQTKSGYMHVKDAKGVERYCVLGVLCDVYGKIGWDEGFVPNFSDKVKLVYRYDGNSRTPGSELEKKFMLENEDVHYLFDRNDDGMTFKKLADWIEENL